MLSCLEEELIGTVTSTLQNLLQKQFGKYIYEHSANF